MCNIYDADSLHPITTEMSLERTETSMHEVRGYTLIMTSPSRRLVNAHFFSLSPHYRRETRLRSSLFGTLSSCTSTSASRKVRFPIECSECSKKFLEVIREFRKKTSRDSRRGINARSLPVLPGRIHLPGRKFIQSRLRFARGSSANNSIYSLY